MNTEERERALLRLITDDRDERCRALLADAQKRARALIADAYRRQRPMLHQRIVAERSRAEGLLRAATAERATAERRRGEQADSRFIATAWPRLRAHLIERWADARSRVLWVETALSQALQRLPRGSWTIRHAGGWPEAERSAALARLHAAGVDAPALHADAEIEAGLVIAAGGGLLDMSVAGLLCDRARIEGRLLALAEQTRGGGSVAPGIQQEAEA
jgi:hypothetical protein